MFKITKSKGISLVVQSTLIFIVFIMLLSYIQLMNRRFETKFFMSHNHVKLNKTTDFDLNLLDISGILETKNVVIISEYNDQRYLGIYDPSVFYPPHNLYYKLGDYRYFSDLDYMNKNKSGIIIDDNLFINESYDKKMCENRLSQKVDDIIYCSDSNNLLSNYGEYTEIINLTSLEDAGDTVYLDYRIPEGKSEVKKIISALEENGYDLVSKDLRLLDIFKGIPLSLRSFYFLIVILSISLYLFYAVIVFWFFESNKKSIRVLYNHGATPSKLAKEFIMGKMTTYFICTTLVMLFLIVQRRNGLLIMDPLSLSLLYIIHLICVGMINYMVLSKTYKRILKEKYYD